MKPESMRASGTCDPGGTLAAEGMGHAPAAKIRQSSIYMLILKVISYIVGFVIMVFIIRKLSIKDFGIYNLLYAVLGYVGLFSSLGIPSLIQRFVPEFYKNREYGNVKKLVKYGVALRCLTTALCIAVILIFAGQIDRLFKVSNWIGYFGIFSIAILTYHVIELLNFSLTALFLHKYFALSNIMYDLFRAAVLYVVLMVNRTLRGILGGEVIAFCFLLGVLVTIVVIKLRGLTDGRSEALPWRRLAHYSGTSYLNELGNTLFDPSTNFFVIAIFIDPVAVGIYAFASQLLTQISKLFPHIILLEVIRPYFFTKFSVNADRDSMCRASVFLIKTIAVYTVPLILTIVVLGDKIIYFVFDPKYITALNVLFILALFKTFLAMQFPFLIILQTMEKIRILMYNNAFALLSLIFSVLGVKYYGIAGAAVATCISIVLQDIFLFFAVHRAVAIKVPAMALLRILGCSLIMAVFMYLLRGAITGLFSLLAVGLAGLVIYLIMSYFGNIFDSRERRFLNSYSGWKLLPA